MVGHQQVFYRLRLFARFLNAPGQLVVAEDTIGNQAIIFCGFFALAFFQPAQLLHALANGNAQRFAQLQRAVFFKLGEGLVAAVVDNLQYAVQSVASHDGRYQHLLGAVA